MTRLELLALPLLTLLTLGELAHPAEAQERAGRDRGAKVDLLEAKVEPQVAWFGRWADAKAEAARTGRPILLMSAAPQCQGTPGVW